MLTFAQLNVVIVLSVLIDVLLGVAVLWLYRRKVERGLGTSVIGVLPLAVATGASFAGYCLAAFVLVGGHLISVFGLVRLAYVNGAVVPAALGGFLLVLALRGNPVRVSVPGRVAATVMLLPLPVCAYASFVEPYRLQIERAVVPVADFGLAGDPIRVAVLADIQTDRITDYEQRVVELTLAERPDVIVLPGDFFQGAEAEFREQLPHFRELLARLQAPGGVFACQGNLDWSPRLEALFEGTGVRRLHNEIAIVNVRGRSLAIGGVEWDYGSQAAGRTIRTLRNTDADARVLLSHAPDVALLTAPHDRIDLVISGHTHGGQVIVPGFGPLLTASRVPRRVAGGGLHRVAHQLLYVSRGVGLERAGAAPIRLFCPPEASLLTLRGE